MFVMRMGCKVPRCYIGRVVIAKHEMTCTHIMVRIFIALYTRADIHEFPYVQQRVIVASTWRKYSSIRIHELSQAVVAPSLDAGAVLLHLPILHALEDQESGRLCRLLPVDSRISAQILQYACAFFQCLALHRLSVCV